MTVDHRSRPEVPGIDVGRLDRWLAVTLPGAGRVDAVHLIAGGRSNLTYRVTLTGGRGVVLRRPPLGHVLPTAHDMGREHTVLSALSAHGGVPVPRPLAFCADPEVIGASFFLMEFVEGQALRTVEDAAAAGVSPHQAAALSERCAEVLGAIHTVDPAAAGLAGFGRAEGYLSRQLIRWGRQWERSQEAIRATGATRALPEYDRLAARLAERLPESGPTGLVHGDYRLDNALVALEPRPRIAAVVDWEMSTLGDPLADLGLTLVYWAEAADAGRDITAVSSTVTMSPGFHTRKEFTERYAAATGFDLAAIDFYVAFGCYKLAVILEGIHARFLQNATVGDGFDAMGGSVPTLLERAHRILDSGSPW